MQPEGGEGPTRWGGPTRWEGTTRWGGADKVGEDDKVEESAKYTTKEMVQSSPLKCIITVLLSLLGDNTVGGDRG